ncbi:dihydroorotate dehydrogenase-like protein [Salsipaludibacter albus]|uniref:dihydroorotate dehydrogenase-like protein n=1 Tax=Salsipaludibacter albus TaxID=2849650 RepID=UPI001EE48ACD|nr:dihydroorotate dehydrogenase-like protein [Salsipaludibacter albus]MBY5164464.1 dihydroorotate dehydrogenase-like protein [Salsipaludibacter albus]
MTELATTYLGLDVSSPIVASSSPLTGTMDGLRALVDAGVGAVVLPSLFEEQIVHESRDLVTMLEETASFNPEASDGYFPELDDYNTGPDRYLDHLAEAVRELDVPVIASLNGVSIGGWLRYARQLADAGASAIECNVYRLAVDVDDQPWEVEDDLVNLVGEVAETVDVPVAVKLSPYFTALANLARRLEDAGAAGLVLFNRFYQPDIDVDTRAVVPSLVLSSPHEQLLPLRWTAVLHGRVGTSLAITTGVHDAEGVAKALLAGADVAMVASAVLRHGPSLVASMLDGLQTWMDEHDYDSVDQLRGSASQAAVSDPDAFVRANYLQTLTSWSTPIPA